MENEKFIKCLTDPVQSKIFLTILNVGPMTTKDLLKKDLGIPQATLYRALKKLEDNQILSVVKQNKVRAVTEKVYDVSEGFRESGLNSLAQNDPQMYFHLFSMFTVGLLEEFKSYVDEDNIDIEKDGSAFSTVPFYATTDELQTISHEIEKILTPFLERNNEQQSLRSLAMIVTPPKKVIEDQANE